MGRLLVAATPRGLVRVSFQGERIEDVLAELSERLSPRVLEAPARLDEVRRELDEYFGGSRRSFELPLDWALTGSDFRRRVLERTARIPYGGTASYRDVGDCSRQRAGGAGGQERRLALTRSRSWCPAIRCFAAAAGWAATAAAWDAKRYLLDLEAGRGEG